MKRLFGGHRNLVYKTNGFVKVIWQNGYKRLKQIREGVLLENFVAAHTDIKARLLVDKSKPVQEEDGKLVTYFHYAAGEIRYPWNLVEIASAAELLAKLHLVMNPKLSNHISHTPYSLLHTPYTLHLDFARGNILFQPETPSAVGVIDFETTALGPVEQELGRTISFLLIDSPTYPSLRGVTTLGRDDVAIPERSPRSLRSLAMTFKQRFNTFLTNYSLPFRKDKVINWTLRYLTHEDYGDLNLIRNQAVSWLRDSNLTI